MACSAIALGLLIFPSRPMKADAAPAAGATATANAGTNRAARPAARVELVAPADGDLSIHADQVVRDSIARQMQLAGSVVLTWKNGLQLRAHRARLAFGREPRNGPSRIFLEPLLAAPVELRLPEGLELKSLVGDHAHFKDGSPRTIRVEDSATLDWANGFQLRATHARITLVETRPDRWGRMLIEPLPDVPAGQ